MRAAIYCRVSTEDQEREGTSLQTQLDACLAYCQQKGYQVAHRFNETYSGLTLERPKLNELRDLIRSNDIDVVVIYCLDRLSRDPTDGAILLQELEKRKVKLEAVTEALESTDFGKLIIYVSGLASKLEAQKIRERTIRGKNARLKEGKLPQGTGIGIYGYQWDKATGRRTVIEYEAKVVQNIFAMVLQGYSFRKIALELNKASIKSKSGSSWYPLTIRRIVTNEAYTGKTYFHMTKRTADNKVTSRPREDWILLPDVTPAIISEEMFNRTQELLRQTKQARPIKQRSPYLLVGFIKCSKCGSPICGTTLNRKYRYYQCIGARPTTTRGKICDCGYIRANELENSIWNKIIEMLSHPKTILNLIASFDEFEHQKSEQEDILPVIDKQIEQLRKRLKTYPAKETNLYDLLSHDAVTKDLLLDAINKLKRERLNDQHQLKDLLSTREQAKSKWTKLELDELTNIIVSEILNSTNNKGIPTDNLLQKRRLLEGIRLEIIADPHNYQFNFKLGGFLISTQNYYRPDTVTEDELAHLKEKFGDEFYAPTENELAELEKARAKENKETQTANHVFKMTYSFNRPLVVLRNYVKNLVATEQTSRCLCSGDLDGRKPKMNHF
jgi:site-specific DNA recombinase